MQSASLIGSQTFTNAYDLLLGKWNTPSYPYWFNGVLDDVRIYNRALTRNEVKQLYNSSPTPTIKGTVFVDGNANGIFDGNDAPKANVKVVLSNGEIAFTDINGNYQFDADSLGTYSITANPPHIFAAFPAVDSFYFHSLDTTVIRNFALQQTTLAFDSLSINIIPLINVARPGFPYPVVVTYENTGTSMLNTAINFKYDTTKLRYDSSSNKYAIQNWNIIGITNDTMYPGDRTAFLAYFTVKTTAILGDTVRLYATIAANAVYSIDSVLAQIRGSYDPNSKEATPFLTLPQVQSDADIDYIIRFENTGTDTAFTVVITDTLSTKLRSSSIQMINSSHPCKLTIKDQLLRFEFIDINLPDSHTNRTTCHGFVNFKVKPRTDLSEGSLINNKASIYFDYNLPIVTNTATTLIKPIITPVKLIKYEVQIASFSANNEQQVTNRWITSTELNVSHFNIQRSIDGNNFFTIGKVVAKGASEYTFIDPLKTNSLPTNVFYRLEIIDHNGSKNYSKIRMLNIKPTTSIITVYPNPAKDGITVTTNKQTLNIIPERNMLTLSDIAGKLIKKVLLTSQQQYINISELAKGVYILSFETGEKIKLIKQ